jgi:hypothetical protein
MAEISATASLLEKKGTFTQVTIVSQAMPKLRSAQAAFPQVLFEDSIHLVLYPGYLQALNAVLAHFTEQRSYLA